MTFERLNIYMSINGVLFVIRAMFTVTQYPNVSCGGQMRFLIALGDTMLHFILLCGLSFIAIRAKNEKEAANKPPKYDDAPIAPQKEQIA